ncbi:MAG: hypothetical protein V9F00_12210 [Nocardioides sp.]
MGSHVDGTRAALVPAPPIYDPGGPILFLHDVRDLTAIAHSRKEAKRCGSALVVVDQPVGKGDLAQALAKEGFTRHCDFFSSPTNPARRVSAEAGDPEQVLRT